MEKTNDDVIDMITTLPDAVQVHILSFLSTKEAVGTCTLSKRWKSTWACVPVLDINLEEFRGCTYEEREAKFKRFVKGVWLNREPSNLEKLKLVCYAKNCASFNSGALEGRILLAMKFKPQELSLSVSKPETLSFDTDPISIFASLHDDVLEQNLRNGFVEVAPSSVHLPCLKRLHPSCVIVNDDFVDKIFLGCPMLEELLLHDCILNANEISSGKLKKLVIIDCCLEQSLKISTPVLLELEVRGCRRNICSMSWINLIAVTFSWGTMASLNNARIEFPALYDADELADVGFKLLTSLSNITSLDLQLIESQAQGLVKKVVPNSPIFNNLKTLTLRGWCMSRDFELVAFFLHSPNLQRLTLCSYNDPLQSLIWGLNDDTDDDTDEKLSQEEARGALFQREQLEMVKIIKSSENDEYVDQLVDKLYTHVKTIGEIIII